MAEADCGYSSEDSMVEFSVCSKRKLLNTLVINWRIEHVSTIDVVRIPEISIPPNGSCFIELEASPDCLTFVVFVENWEDLVQCKFSASDVNGKILYSNCLIIEGAETLLLDSEVLRIFRDGGMDVLMIKCVLKKFGDVSTTMCTQNRTTSFEGCALKKIANDLKELQDSNFLTDVNLVFGEDTLPVHKVILCARSPVFAKMFMHNASESEKNSVTITDIGLSVARNLVTFLYSGELCNTDFDSYYDLYYAADKYAVLDLRQMCGEALLTHLKIDNACQVLSLADLHGDEYLNSKVTNFISHNLERVIKSDGWAKYIDGKLSAQILSKS